MSQCSVCVRLGTAKKLEAKRKKADSDRCQANDIREQLKWIFLHLVAGSAFLLCSIFL